MIRLVDIKSDCICQSSVTGLSLGEMVYANRELMFCLFGFLLGVLGKKWHDHFALREPTFCLHIKKKYCLTSI